MRVLITAGPTREPIDAVRYIGNRSSGRMGAALAQAALLANHQVTVIAGPIAVPIPAGATRIDVETAADMHRAVLAHFPLHDLLIMAAAVADYRPKAVLAGKTPRTDFLTIECEATADIIADAGRTKRADQRTVGFSLEIAGNIDRAREKLHRKRLDLIVYNPPETMESSIIAPILLWPNGDRREIHFTSKEDFARRLITEADRLFETSAK